MNTIYRVLEDIKTELENDPQVNTVSFGDFFNLDLNKTTLYSIAHVNLNNITFGEQAHTVNFSIIFADIIDEDKTQAYDTFYQSNIIDIFNTQTLVANILVDKLRRGSLMRSGYELSGDANIELFKEKYDNYLCGVVLTFDVLVKNDTRIC